MSKSFNADSMPLGHNGQRRSPEISATAQTAEAWEFNTDVGVRWNIEPLQKKYPGLSPYSVVSGNPILYSDKDGRDKIVTITILNKDGTNTQIQKIDKDYFHYYKDSRYDGGGYYYYKESVMQHLIIDNRDGRNITVEEAMNNPDKFIYSSEFVNRKEIGGWNYWTRWLSSVGDQSDKVMYGYRMYGNGTDMEWQKGLPTAAPGSPSIDLKPLLDAVEGYGDLSGIKPGASDIIRDFTSNKKLANILTAFENIANSIKTTNNAIENSKSDNFENIKSGLPKKGTVYYDRNLKRNIERDTDSTGKLSDKKATDTLPK